MSRTPQPIWDEMAARSLAAAVDAPPPVLVLLDVGVLREPAGEGEG